MPSQESGGSNLDAHSADAPTRAPRGRAMGQGSNRGLIDPGRPVLDSCGSDPEWNRSSLAPYGRTTGASTPLLSNS